jgi:hypothetical protein
MRNDEVEPPICPVCGVTMVPTELSSLPQADAEWVCLECEENGETDQP